METPILSILLELRKTKHDIQIQRHSVQTKPVTAPSVTHAARVLAKTRIYWVVSSHADSCNHQKTIVYHLYNLNTWMCIYTYIYTYIWNIYIYIHVYIYIFPRISPYYSWCSKTIETMNLMVLPPSSRAFRNRSHLCVRFGARSPPGPWAPRTDGRGHGRASCGCLWLGMEVSI